MWQVCRAARNKPIWNPTWNPAWNLNGHPLDLVGENPNVAEPPETQTTGNPIWNLNGHLIIYGNFNIIYMGLIFRLLFPVSAAMANMELLDEHLLALWGFILTYYTIKKYKNI